MTARRFRPGTARLPTPAIVTKIKTVGGTGGPTVPTVARAPATIANVGPGFDVFGLAVDGFHDEIRATETDEGVELRVPDDLPDDPRRNTAGLAALELLKRHDLPGVRLELRKGVPIGGLGSSAASAVAAALAIDRLYDLHLPRTELLRTAARAERAAAGEPHYDNVAPALLGGFVIWRSEREHARLTPPPDLRLVTATPTHVHVPTERARRALRERTPDLKDIVNNLSAAALMVHALHEKDAETLARLMDHDRLSEPVRKRFIPGYDRLERTAREAGALAFTVSGAGPTVVAACLREDAKNVASALKEATDDRWIVKIHRPDDRGAQCR